MGFPVPLKEWMQGGSVKEFVSDTLLSEKSKNRVFTVYNLEDMISNLGVGGRQLTGSIVIRTLASAIY